MLVGPSPLTVAFRGAEPPDRALARSPLQHGKAPRGSGGGGVSPGGLPRRRSALSGGLSPPRNAGVKARVAAFAATACGGLDTRGRRGGATPATPQRRHSAAGQPNGWQVREPLFLGLLGCVHTPLCYGPEPLNLTAALGRQQNCSPLRRRLSWCSFRDAACRRRTLAPVWPREEGGRRRSCRAGFATGPR